MTRSDMSPLRDADSAARLVRVVPMLRGLDEALVRGLASTSSLHRLERGQRFWMRGEAAEHFHLVIRGVLELRRASGSSEPTLIALFGPGECPAIPVTLERGRYGADAHALSEGLEVLRIPSELLIERLPRDATLAMTMNRALIAHSRLLHSKIDVLTAGPIPRRIATFLLDLMSRFGDERDDGTHAIPLVLPRGRVASYVDARVETVIRCMSTWRRAGLVIEEDDATVIPDLDALRAAVEPA